MKVLGKILAVFYSIFFTFTLLFFSLVLVFSNFLKGSFYTKIFESIIALYIF